MKRKIVVITLSILVFTTGVFFLTGCKKNPEDKSKYISEKLAKKLELTPSQKKEVYQMTLAHWAAVKKEYSQKTLSKAERKKYKKEWKKKLKKILTEEQYKKIKKKFKNE